MSDPKDQDLILTQSIPPVSPEPARRSIHYHSAKIQAEVAVETGEIRLLLVCDCGQTTLFATHLVRGFHGAKGVL